MTDFRRSILIVDDEPLIADTLALILRHAWFDPSVAYNGGTALEIARRTRPDVVLSDVILPGMSGLDLVLQIRKLLPGVRLLLFSGQAVTAEMLEAKEGGQE